MKKVIMLFVGTLLASSALAEEVKVSVPSLDKVQKIGLGFNSLWYASLFPNGWGRIAIAGGGTICADAEEKTLSFEEIYNLLVPHLRAKREYVEDVGVFFERGVSPEGRPFGEEGWLSDPETISKLLRMLRDKMKAWNTGQLDDFFREDPLLRGYDTDGNPIPGYVRTPYVPMGDSPDVFADNPKQPQIAEGDDDVPAAPPQPAVQEKPPEPPAVIPPEPAVEQTPAVGDKTTTDIAEGEPSQAKSNASNRWLYALIPLGLLAVLYLLRKKRK